MRIQKGATSNFFMSKALYVYILCPVKTKLSKYITKTFKNNPPKKLPRQSLSVKRLAYIRRHILMTSFHDYVLFAHKNDQVKLFIINVLIDSR